MMKNVVNWRTLDRGFTMIELMVVLIALVILAAAVVPRRRCSDTRKSLDAQ